MMLTDREWLRFVTFAFVSSGILGSVTAGAFLLEGVPPVQALVGSVAWIGAIGVVLHLTVRYLLDRASEPPAEQPETEETHA